MRSRVRRSTFVGLLAVALAAAFPQLAAATIVRGESDLGTVDIEDLVGVVDKLEVSGGDTEDSVRVTSTNGIPIIADTGACTQVSPTVVNCNFSRGTNIRVGANLGGGDDNLLNRTHRSNLEGGDGNDTITGGVRDDTIRGGPGNDTLDGGRGNDTLLGQAGDDTSQGGQDNDKIGAAGPNPSQFDDPGVDTVLGGGPGDELFTADATPDARIVCGPIRQPFGIARIDLVDPAPVNCGTVRRAAKDQHPTVEVRRVAKVRGKTAKLRLRCPAAAPGGSCAGTLTLLRRGRELGSKRYSIRAGRSKTVRVRLRRKARGAAEVRTSELDTQGRPETTITSVRLKR